jgi:hypothetical protein
MRFKFGTPDGKMFEAFWEDGTLKVKDDQFADAIDFLIREGRFVAASPLGPFVPAGLGTQVEAYATLLEAAWALNYRVLAQPDLGYGIEPDSLGE